MRKLRLNRELHERALECADAIHEPFAEFARLCILHWSRGALRDVATPSRVLSATDGDAVVSLYDTDLPGSELRRAIAAGVIDAERRRPPAFRTDKIEGVHYLVEAGE